MAKGLTKRQETILRFIIESIRDMGYPPTIAEIGEEFGISSTNGVNDHLLALHKKGYIERSSKARGIHVMPKAAAGLYQHESAMIPLSQESLQALPRLSATQREPIHPAAVPSMPDSRQSPASRNADHGRLSNRPRSVESPLWEIPPPTLSQNPLQRN